MKHKAQHRSVLGLINILIDTEKFAHLAKMTESDRQIFK